MASTEQQQALILQLSQAMFNAAPGKIFLDLLCSKLAAGQSLADLANMLSGNNIFFDKQYPRFSCLENPELFINDLIHDLTGDHLSSVNISRVRDFVVNKMETGITEDELVAELIQAVSSIPPNDPDWGEAALFYDTKSIVKVIDHLVGDTVSETNKASVADYMVDQIIAEQSFGAMVELGITTLSKVDHADEVWGKAAALFDNRIEVSKYYSIDKAGASTYLPTLQQVLTNVSADPKTVSIAKTEIDTLLISIINLASLNGDNGFRLDGVAENDYLGSSLSSAGDFNGDGFDELIIGARNADPNGSRSGSSYVVFGNTSGFNAALSLSSLDGNNGFRLDGVEEFDRSGFSVSNAGDINGDGFDDLIVGAPFTYRNDLYGLGSSYVVFGKATIGSASLNLSSLDGSNGFRLDGVAEYDFAGFSVSGAGDVNGDGFDDLIIGAPNDYANDAFSPGSSYIIFGKSSDFDVAINLSDLDGNNGFRIDGVTAFARTGSQVGSAGDINGDGFDDLVIVSSDSVLLNGIYYSASINVVFGKSSGFSASFNLSDLDGKSGFRLIDLEGSDVVAKTAGDINGDGFDDLIVSNSFADPNDIENSGSSYVVFGRSSGFDATFDLSSLDGSNGFRLNGESEYDLSGSSVSSAGDINSDGFDDLIIGASNASPDGIENAGSSYVVYGKTLFNKELNLSNLNGRNGFRLDGAMKYDQSGASISSAGDINGDGFDDLIIGAPYADQNGIYNSGSSYVVFGGSFVVDNSDNIMNDDSGANVFKADAGNDIIMLSDIDFQLIDVGNGHDRLELIGGGLNLNLASISDTINDIENINLVGDGDNTLTLGTLDLLNLSDSSNTLVVDGNAGDKVVLLDDDWIDGGTENSYLVYTHNAAVLMIGINMTIDFI